MFGFWTRQVDYVIVQGAVLIDLEIVRLITCR